MQTLLLRHGKAAGGYVIEDRAEDLTLAVFAHGGSLSARLGFLLGIPPFLVALFSFDMAGIARVRMHRKRDDWYPQLVPAA